MDQTYSDAAFEPPQTKLNVWFGVTSDEVAELFRFHPNPAARNKAILYLIGIFLTPITLTGALLGYVRSYNRFVKPLDEYPELYPLKPIVRFAMLMGALLIWAALIFFSILLFRIFGLSRATGYVLLIYTSFNLLLSLMVFTVFRRWQIGINNAIVEGNRFGSARFAKASELDAYRQDPGIYIGGGFVFKDKGHILTVAGTRGGKGTNLIIPNLLGLTSYQGSWAVIDPKGENAAITARYQRSTGRRVIILNPWGLLADHIGESESYNPLDILADTSSIHLVDDAQMIAEMLVPIEKSDKNKFFTDTARSIVTGLIMQIATTQEGENRSLATLWRWARLAGDQWDELIARMRLNNDPVNGEIVRNAGNEIVKLMEAGEETFGSILSSVLQATDFLKSPALQKALQSGFDPSSLSDGNTALYIIIPADKLQSHARWLRLIVTTTLRSVVRKPNKRVTFLLDEFAALGYLPEIETALSTYAGFEVTVWPILQSLIQLKGQYGDNWETFTANTAVRQFFSVNDNFTADYVSAAIGQTSHVITSKSWFGVSDANANPRPLVTPDEVRRGSADYMFAFLGGNPPTVFAKRPYYQIIDLQNRASENPYFKIL
ncbi:type IV secretory system conjugative DNA transfer family protein [Siphonobacter sp. SORGH_AS_1065]|uniref:type IV secretory system conjugative DNA transfer family protein n=1 Tax=Siphonobacter sp. SORGH_AS_1065 TaxID=3041795 RepID=UPI0027800C73|nr:type IV secretory system conjugative DNA transfer family protein [Siphonobacter sp. SORGH_AS_1065]MDQ1086182.1 type IV secretion system protein VirD4 [Siphonobacter sp. SORGH_AS_1065]